MLFNAHSFQGRDTVFSKILGRAVSLSSITYVNRVIDPSSSFYECIFKDISGSLSGSAVYSNQNSELNFSYCTFIKCVSENGGGAIYKNNGRCSIFGTCFDSCEILGAKNGIYGNAFSLKGSFMSFRNSLLYKCGTSRLIASDSSFYLSGGEQFVENDNFTKNYGYGGASAGLILSPSPTSQYQYIGIYRCGDSAAIEFWNTPPGQNRFVNVINNTDFAYSLFAAIGGVSIGFHNYIMYGNPIAHTCVSIYGAQLNFFNSYGDFAYSGVITNIISSPHSIDLIDLNHCFSEAKITFTKAISRKYITINLLLYSLGQFIIL